ncbi:MAG: DUF2177 family protein [Candidatus Gracilibacteria bacterium]|nr:DUF2177 family protein [Candidatus Gracilibacteria bacterium]
METFKLFGVYFVGFLTLLILDYLWLGYVTKDFIVREFGNLVSVDDSGSIKINLTAGLLAWFIISAMIVTFVTLKYNNILDILFYGALLGFFSYAMYDLTNLTFINNYSLKFTLVDIAWGTFACSLVAMNSFYFYNLIK